VGDLPALSEVANDGMSWVYQHDLFCSDFCFGVHAERINRRSFVIISGPAIEDQVRGKQDEGDVRRQFGQDLRDLDVQLPGQRGIGLAGRTFAQGRAVNYGCWFLALELPAYSDEVIQIEPGSSQPDRLYTGRKFLRRFDQVMANETAGTGDPDRFARHAKAVQPIADGAICNW